MRKVMSLTSVAILALLGGYGVFAQDREQPDRTGKKGDDVRPANAANTRLDSDLAKCLAIDNWVEIEFARFAESKSPSAEVKELAEMLQKDHTQFVNRLKEVDPSIATLMLDDASPSRDDGNVRQDARKQPEARTPDRSADEPRDPKAPTAGRPGQPQEPQDGRIAKHSDADASQMLQIKQEIAQACLETLKKELGGKSEDDFDRCFVVYQVGAHLRMLDTLKVFERHSSPKLAQAVKAATETTQKHLDHAKQLVTKCEAKANLASKSSDNAK